MSACPVLKLGLTLPISLTTNNLNWSFSPSNMLATILLCSWCSLGQKCSSLLSVCSSSSHPREDFSGHTTKPWSSCPSTTYHSTLVLCIARFAICSFIIHLLSVSLPNPEPPTPWTKNSTMESLYRFLHHCYLVHPKCFWKDE